MKLPIALSLCLLAVVGVSAIPVDTTEPAASNNAMIAADNIDGNPGSSCLALAYEEYAYVLSDPDNEEHHFILATTYYNLGHDGLEC